MAGVPPYRRPVNMMFQSYALFPHMTAAQNIAFGLKQDRVPKPEREARVAAMLDLVKLARLAQRKPHQLSGGERQRVALARALAQEPKLVLLDEPLAALDRKLREETRFELVRIQQRVGITFLMVTHDQEEAMSMASRIAVMSQGRIVQLGTPQRDLRDSGEPLRRRFHRRREPARGPRAARPRRAHRGRERRGRRDARRRASRARPRQRRGDRGQAGEDRLRSPRRRGQPARGPGARHRLSRRGLDL